MPLKLVAGETEVYEATYEIAAGDAIFRFYEELGNWEKGSIGSQVDDLPLAITLPAEESFVGDFVWGKGSWNITDWDGYRRSLNKIASQCSDGVCYSQLLNSRRTLEKVSRELGYKL